MQLSGNPEIFPFSAIKTKKQYNITTDSARGVFTLTAAFRWMKKVCPGPDGLAFLPREPARREAAAGAAAARDPEKRDGTGTPALPRCFPGVRGGINQASSFCSRLSNGTDVLRVLEESLNKKFGSLALSKLNFDSTYTVVVAASNELGSAASQPLVFTLIDIGKRVTRCLSAR